MSQPKTISFESSPAPKSWFTKKFIPAARKFGIIAGKVSSIVALL